MGSASLGSGGNAIAVGAEAEASLFATGAGVDVAVADVVEAVVEATLGFVLLPLLTKSTADTAEMTTRAMAPAPINTIVCADMGVPRFATRPPPSPDVMGV